MTSTAATLGDRRRAPRPLRGRHRARERPRPPARLRRLRDVPRRGRRAALPRGPPRPARRSADAVGLPLPRGTGGVAADVQALVDANGDGRRPRCRSSSRADRRTTASPSGSPPASSTLGAGAAATTRAHGRGAHHAPARPRAPRGEEHQLPHRSCGSRPPCAPPARSTSSTTTASHVAEGARSALAIVQDGTLVTRREGVLASVSMAQLLVVARPRMRVEERAITLEELHAADEVLSTGAVRGVVPIVAIDGRPVGDGAVGPHARRAVRGLRRARRGIPRDAS